LTAFFRILSLFLFEKEERAHTEICVLSNTTELADAVNAAFDPPAELVWELDAYFVDCDAVAPVFSVVVGGVAFVVNPRDLIFRAWQDELTGLCMTAIGSGGTGPYILGATFLQNVLAVFDVGYAQMRFIGRPYY